MITPITRDELDFAKLLLNTRGIDAMYDHFARRGHRYARLARGVALGNMLSGLVALEFMETTRYSASPVQIIRALSHASLH